MMNMGFMLNRSFIISFLSILSFGSLSAQISFSDYLMSNIQIEEAKVGVDNLPNAIVYKAPLIRRWDFRTDTDEFLLDRQEYQLRGNVTNRATRKYQNKLYQGYVEELKFEQAKTAQIDVEVLYDRWLDSYFALKEKAIDQAIIPFLNDQILMLKKVDLDGGISLYDYLEKQKELELLQWDLSKIDKTINELNPEVDNVISIDRIENFAETINLKLVLQYTDYESDLLDVQRIEDEYKLEEAQAKQVFDFFRVNYRGPSSNLFEERLSVGLAFNFRRSEKRELDLVELKFEKEMEEEQIAQRKLRFQAEVSKAFYDLRNSIEAYHSFEQLLDKLNDQYLVLDQQSPVNKRDILKWLDLKIDRLKNQEALIELEKDVYESYVEWLDVTGLLEQYYRTDFLSSALSAEFFTSPNTAE
jgi:hypothetical protein